MGSDPDLDDAPEDGSPDTTDIGYLCEDCRKQESWYFGERNDTKKCRHCYND